MRNVMADPRGGPAPPSLSEHQTTERIKKLMANMREHNNLHTQHCMQRQHTDNVAQVSNPSAYHHLASLEDF
jgi:hypothetical protein